MNYTCNFLNWWLKPMPLHLSIPPGRFVFLFWDTFLNWGLNLWSSCLSLPKYWDYKNVPAHSSSSYFIILKASSDIYLQMVGQEVSKSPKGSGWIPVAVVAWGRGPLVMSGGYRSHSSQCHIAGCRFVWLHIWEYLSMQYLLNGVNHSVFTRVSWLPREQNIRISLLKLSL